MIALGCASPVFAALTCSAPGAYFAEQGNASTGEQQEAEACVTIGTNTITVVLESDNTIATNIPSILDGFSLNLSGPATGLGFTTDTTLSPVAASGFIDCTDGASCATVSTFDSDTNGQGGGPLLSPYNWGVVTGASGAPISQTFSTTNPAVLAGGGSLHPAGIINTVDSTQDTGQHLNDKAHNDYLLGPVTFNLAFTGMAPTVNGITFYWGTNGDAHGGTLNGTPFSSDTPEPASVLFLGAAFVVCAKVLKARKGSA